VSGPSLHRSKEEVANSNVKGREEKKRKEGRKEGAGGCEVLMAAVFTRDNGRGKRR